MSMPSDRLAAFGGARPVPSTNANGELRPIDLAVSPNQPGNIDLGPQEVITSTDDLIFRSSVDPG